MTSRLDIWKFKNPPPPGINIGDNVQIVTTNNDTEWSRRIARNSLADIIISNGPFTDATFSKKENPILKGNHGQRFPDHEVAVSTNTGQQTTLNQLTDGDRNISSFYFVIPDNEISKVTFTFVEPTFMPLTGNFLKRKYVRHMKYILRYYFKCVPEAHVSKLVLQGDGGTLHHFLELDDDLLISDLGDNPIITVYFVKFKGNGGRKSRRRKSNKNKRTRRKSLKKQHRRRK